MDLICGINPVLEALGAESRHFDRLMVVKGLRNRRVAEAIAKATQLGVPLRFESRETLDRLSGGVTHQGLIAVVSPKPVTRLEELLDAARDPALLLLLDGVVDPRNLGALVRCADAAGADGVVVPERRSAGLSEVVSRASAGALEHVSVARVGNLSQSIAEMQRRGIWVVALDAVGGDRWDAVDYARPIAVVAGGEGRGVRRLVRERCDQVVSLPLFGHVSSLNVSVATGVLLYEVIRQRGKVPSQVRPIPPPPPPESRVLGPGPDDPEIDPGRLAPPPELGELDDEGDLEPLSLVTLDDEEVAWGGGANVEVVQRRSRVRSLGNRGGNGRSGGQGRRGRGGPPRRKGRRPPAVSAERADGGAGTPAEQADASRSPRRKRRRRSSGSGGAEGKGAPDAPPGDDPASARGGEEGAPRTGRRRRRRRRR
jgi:23S rRNA (guanosine2251-2'-O)-methyltransferase